MKRALLYIQNIIFGIILFLTLVLCAEWICSRITVRTLHPGGDITVYLLSNGAHTDIVLPVRNHIIDWDTVFPSGNTLARDTTLPYLGIGWGDKGFYLETPSWSDLTVSTAFHAMTGLSSSALHCTYMTRPQPGVRCAATQINAEQYRQLIVFIRQTARGSSPHAIPLLIRTSAVYGRYDAFYEAHGSYHLFNTCNTWTNRALKKAGMKAAVWLLFEKQLIDIYK